MAKISGPALAATAGGAVLLYAGIRGKDILSVVKSVISGAGPGSVQSTQAIQQVTEDAGATVAPDTGAAAAPDAGASVYTSAQLQALWIMNGGSQATAATAACIASHESSGVPTVTSANPDGGTNVGLWQLDTRGKGAGYSVAQLQDPNTNARVAIAGSSNGTNWSAWSTAPDCGV